jgi:DnaK suppressor protein
MSTAPRVIRGKFGTLQRQLSEERDALLARFARQRSEIIVDREPDDECAEANRNLARHLILSTLDRERRTLTEIEVALKRLEAGEYGVCDSCGSSISVARLTALPWTRFCIDCANHAARA